MARSRALQATLLIVQFAAHHCHPRAGAVLLYGCKDLWNVHPYISLTNISDGSVIGSASIHQASLYGSVSGVASVCGTTEFDVFTVSTILAPGAASRLTRTSITAQGINVTDFCVMPTGYDQVPWLASLPNGSFAAISPAPRPGSDYDALVLTPDSLNGDACGFAVAATLSDSAALMTMNRPVTVGELVVTLVEDSAAPSPAVGKRVSLYVFNTTVWSGETRPIPWESIVPQTTPSLERCGTGNVAPCSMQIVADPCSRRLFALVVVGDGVGVEPITFVLELTAMLATSSTARKPVLLSFNTSLFADGHQPYFGFAPQPVGSEFIGQEYQGDNLFYGWNITTGQRSFKGSKSPGLWGSCPGTWKVLGIGPSLMAPLH